jgi:hypothetical protein
MKGRSKVKGQREKGKGKREKPKVKESYAQFPLLLLPFTFNL